MNVRGNHTSEKWLERALCAFVTSRGGATVKLSDPGRNGLPDRLVLWPGGRAEFVELKSTGEKPEPLQRSVHAHLRDMGFQNTVIDNELTLKRWENECNG